MTEIFSDEDNFEEYTIYYTGTYDAQAADNNHGLTFHCVPADEFDENETEDLFTADEKENQLVQYNAVNVDIPVNFSARIVSITVA